MLAEPLPSDHQVQPTFAEASAGHTGIRRRAHSSRSPPAAASGLRVRTSGLHGGVHRHTGATGGLGRSVRFLGLEGDRGQRTEDDVGLCSSHSPTPSPHGGRGWSLCISSGSYAVWPQPLSSTE